LKGYSIPLSPEGRAQLYFKPPKRFGGRIMSVVFKADPDALNALIPPPLEPLDEPYGIVRVSELINDHGGGDRWLEDEPEWVQYSEAVVCIPAAYKGRVGNYDPYLWVDNHACAAGGREIYGLPKKMAKVFLSRFYPSDPIGPGKKLTGTLEGLSRRLITASVRITGECTPAELPKTETFYGYRVLPHPEEDRHEIEQLLEFKLQNYKYTKLFKGEGSLSFGDSPAEELTALGPTEIVGGFYQEVDWLLPWPTILWDRNASPAEEPALAAGELVGAAR
jgi:acetoacetate decarboxylase